MSKKILIVVDMQNDFIYGSLGSPEAREIVPNVVAKVQQYKKEGNMILYTMDTHNRAYLDTQEGKKLPVPHCIEFTYGWEIIPELKAVDSNIEAQKDDPFGCVIKKESFGSIEWPFRLPYMMEEIEEEIEMVGVCTEICLISNALMIKPYRPRTEIIVDASCCAGVSPEMHQAALKVMKSCQITVIGE